MLNLAKKSSLGKNIAFRGKLLPITGFIEELRKMKEKEAEESGKKENSKK